MDIKETTDTIEYITVSSTGYQTDFGDLEEELKAEKKRKEILFRQYGDKEEKKDLAIFDDERINALKLFSRIEPGALMKFHTFDLKKIEKLAENMPEIYRAARSFGRQNTQTTNKLMTLNMISASPYRRLRQCVAQIERKISALKENYFRIEKEKIELEKIKEKLRDRDLDYYERQLAEIELAEKASGMADSALYIEGALKELGSFQSAYNQIREANNIPVDWDEQNFEAAEISEHVRTVFNHAIRDITMTGRLNVGTMEYSEQFGINPLILDEEVRDYMLKTKQNDINTLYDFLDRMYEKYGQEYKKVMDRIGLDTLIDADWLYKETV